MGRKTKTYYTSEFKKQAADLAIRVGSARAADQLGVRVENVNRWKKNVNNLEPQTKEEKTDLELEVRRLSKENEELKKINFILKKAAAFFSQDHLK